MEGGESNLDKDSDHAGTQRGYKTDRQTDRRKTSLSARLDQATNLFCGRSPSPTCRPFSSVHSAISILSLVPYQSHPIPSHPLARSAIRSVTSIHSAVSLAITSTIPSLQSISVVAAAAAGWDILFLLVLLQLVVVLSC
ncbi:hypothetical protein ASPFODRAFT_43061 [Aspergillus luchuensis CBS 106.47]|uniref:Uncharacterized protein n=1 Tax=Aspergillus luchuensis (strain CBS 106.47) TaxID=1137211 RepID=A0A1M3TSA8_ASPLC|nr:hypothetical protein ASPFODRAFT_43061 [Aspergillus luchuensis CBS 106.47]